MINKKNLMMLLFIITLSISAYSGKYEAVNDINSINVFRTKIDSIMMEYDIPGVSIALVNSDSIIWAGGFGYADIEKEIPVTENTLFRMGSITKSFISLGFLKLVEEGKISLNTTVKEVAPEISMENPWEDTHPVRIVHLLEHTSGFDYQHFAESYNFDDDPEIPLKEVLNISPSCRKVRWKPGTRFAYSNHGFLLAGYILEKLTGDKYEDYLKKAFLEPLSMHTSAFRFNADSKELLAQGYTEGKTAYPYFNLYTRPAGSFISSAAEVANFLQFIINRGVFKNEVLISEKSIDRMETPTSTSLAKLGFTHLGYGLGNRPRYYSNIKYYGHAGGLPDFTTYYSYIKDKDIGFVLCMNTGIRGTALIGQILEYLLPPEEFLPEPIADVPGEQLMQYEGVYELRNCGEQLSDFLNKLLTGTSITYENDTLYSQDFMSTKVPLIPVSLNTFRRSHENEVSIVFFKEDGGQILSDMRYDVEYQKVPFLKPLLMRSLFALSVILLVGQVLFALVWIPIYLYKRIRNGKSNNMYLPIRIIPLLTLFSLILGLFALQSQMKDHISQAYLGQMTFNTVLFFISTILFALLSLLSAVYSILSFYRPVKRFDRVYGVILASASICLMLFLQHWGLIGLRFWAF